MCVARLGRGPGDAFLSQDTNKETSSVEHLFARLADVLVMQPTTDEIPVEGKSRRLETCQGGDFEIWTQRTQPNVTRPDLFILKFPGTGGRAERATEHPAEFWPDRSAEVWTINPPGYGGSGG